MKRKKIMSKKNNLSLSLDKRNYLNSIQQQALLPLNAEKILEKFPQEELDACWDALCINIIQNYQRGKGTFIKNFGTFTYKCSDINLEGTTNELFRDKKNRCPIFLVSKEFNINLIPGEYNKVSGIRYYTSKENKNISIVNLNFSEIAFSLNMTKDKVVNIIKCLLSHINESIEKKKFKNKKMGILGELILKNNILVVKFEENFENNISGKNKMLNNIKTYVTLDKNLDNTKNLDLGNFPNLYQTSENLKARNSLVTECQPSAKKYLKEKYNITIENSSKYLNEYNKTLNPLRNKLYTSYNSTNKFFTQRKRHPFKFLNDSENNYDINTNYSSSKTNKEKSEDEKTSNPLFKLENSILKKISYFKGAMIKDSKELDINKIGSISKEKAIFMIIKNIPEIKYELAKEIIEYYFNIDQIDYMKLIALIVKSSKNSFLKKKGFFDFTRFLFKNVDIPFAVNRQFNFKDIIKKQKNKKIALIKETDKEREKLNLIKELEEKKNSDENPLFTEEEKWVNKNIKELNFLSDLIPELKIKYATSLEQIININELLHILKDYYEIYYQKEDLEEILKFIEIKNIENFSLREFIDKINLCKLIEKNNDLSQFSKILKIINDVIYMNGGEKFLFNNNRDVLDINTFVKLLKDKCSLDINTLKNAFYYIVKTNRDMTRDDYDEFFAKKSKKKLYDESYFINMMKKIILVINDKFMTSIEYFDRLLSYNESTQDKVISRINWVKYLINKENFNFNAEELDHLFDWIDTKKDNVIDFDEFNEKYQYTIKPLTILKNIIHNNKLDIEDLAHRMGISTDEIKQIDYPTFLNHMKKLDYILPETFIKKIFDELKQTEKKDNKLLEYVNSKKFLDEINYINPPEKYESFTKHYKEVIKSKMSYEELKKTFEKFDHGSSGTMTKLEYVNSISRNFPEFNDDEHMRFIRIMDLLDKENKVKYPELLNTIYYKNINKKNDQFTIICEFLLEKLENECQNDIKKLMHLIENNPKSRISNIEQYKPLTFELFENFLKRENLNIDKKVVLKLDLDSDGLISYDDLYSILFRYKDTLYFKYYNNSNNVNINLFTKDSLTKEKISIIAKKLLTYMKNINITPYGLFKKFDKDDNGLISNIDFNQGLKKYLNIDAALADPFFAYLDFYHIGMVDFETFMNQLTYICEDNLTENDRKIENEIIGKIKSFILKNKNLSDNEIFQIMDKDVDGLISPDDLILFAKENLEIGENLLNRNKIERVMMTLSLTKNLQVGFHDISEFIKLSKINKQNMYLKEVFTLTANQNLSQNKKNVDWGYDIIERLGMYVSEKYDSIEQFYYENIEPGSNKFKFSDFLKFHESHYDLFNNGFHLTKDELLSIFTSLDSQKKDYLTLQDLQNKLQYFNFYKKMHSDLKDFFQTNFDSGIDAFKYFFIEENIKEKRYSITIKEFLDGFESFFPNKYEYNTVLKYLFKYFHVSLDKKENDNDNNVKSTIDFNEFNYLYFEKLESNELFLNNFDKDMKLLNKRSINKYTSNNYYFSSLFKMKKNPKLITPFDQNPYLKFIRIIDSSKNEVNSLIEEIIKQNDGSPNINKFQFRSFIKKLNIGLTNLEIDEIVKKMTNNGINDKINLDRLILELNNEKNSDLSIGIENIKKKISEIKSLIYKFYSSPILCFQIIDINHSGKIDFQKYRNMIYDLYTRNEQELPNFALIKNTFDYIDLRKNGIIDYNEWNKAFSMVNGKLDLEYEKLANDVKELNYIKNYKNELRMWENSDDITQKYMLIYKNRKLIKNKLVDNNFIINKYGKKFVTSDTLIYVIKKLLPNCRLSHIQWKMITDIGKNGNTDNLVNISEFFRFIEISAKKNMNISPINNIKPFNSNNDFNKIYYGKFDTINSNENKGNALNITKLNKTLTSTSCGNSKFKNIII